MNDTFIQVHWAARAAAGVGRTLAPPQPDDSHHSLMWSNEQDALVQSIGSGIRIRDLALLWIDGERVDAFPLAGRTLEDAFAFYEEHGGRMIVRPAEGLPSHAVAHGAAFAPDGGDLARLARLYAEAAAILEQVRANHRDAGPVRCWPHHFDIATLIAHGGGRTTGIGFVPGDAQFPDPYWYVTPWPYPDASTLPPLSHGRWNTEGWVGAVHAADEREEIVRFIDEALRALHVG